MFKLSFRESKELDQGCDDFINREKIPKIKQSSDFYAYLKNKENTANWPTKRLLCRTAVGPILKDHSTKEIAGSAVVLPEWGMEGPYKTQIFFLWYWGLNSALRDSKAGIFLLDPHLQPKF
jgi:hypothetical protein